MNIKILCLSPLLGAGLCSSACAAVITVSGSSASSVNSALNSAASGDTVKVTGSGWSTGTVTIPNNKYITLDGGGLSVSGSIFIPSSADYQARVTNFKWASTARGAVVTGGGKNNKPWRMDHCTIEANTGDIMLPGSGPGLIDHLTAINMQSYVQMIQPQWEGPDTEIGWTDSHTPGSPNAIYIEDSTFTHPSGDIWDGSCVFQVYYGARIVARHNTIKAAMIEVHGSPSSLSSVGGRWWEFYNNTFTGGAICIRAGSGVVFNNTGTATFFAMIEEDSGYPAKYQVGRGQNQTLYPAYVWGNASSIGDPCFNCGGLCSAAAANMIQLNRDVYIAGAGTSLPATATVGQAYWKTDAGGDWDKSNAAANDGALYKCTAANHWELYYVPYTYPHPLQFGFDDNTNRPSPPTDLWVEATQQN